MNEMLLIGWKGYSFTQSDGQKVEGAKITLVPLNAVLKNSLQEGYLPIQETLELDVARSLEVPGIYNVGYTMLPGRNNKPTMQLSTLDFVRKVDFTFPLEDKK